MELGIFTRTFPRLTIGEVIAAAAEAGFFHLQLKFLNRAIFEGPRHVMDRHMQDIRMALHEENVKVAALSGTFNLIHPNPEQRRDGMAYLRSLGRAAEQLDTKVITLCSGTRDPENMWQSHPDNDSAEAWDEMLGAMEEALGAVKNRDVVLAVEPEVNNVVSSAAKARRLLDTFADPKLKLCLDGANLLQGQPQAQQRTLLDEAFELLGDDIALIHGKDFVSGTSTDDLCLGEGELDFDHYLQLIEASPYEGPLILHGFSEQYVARSRQFVAGKLA